jgi:hypothetical protein
MAVIRENIDQPSRPLTPAKGAATNSGSETEMASVARNVAFRPRQGKDCPTRDAKEKTTAKSTATKMMIVSSAFISGNHHTPEPRAR